MKIYDQSMWVTGHLMTPIAVTPAFALMMGETPAGMDGPPPHSHAECDETFGILEGELEFMVDGKSKILRAGENITLPRNVVHTFRNASDQPAKWLNIHAPSGFETFFEQLGIPAGEEQSRERSLAPEVFERFQKLIARPEIDFVMAVPQD